MNFEGSEIKIFIFNLEASLSIMKTVLPLPTVWMIVSLFCFKEFSAWNSVSLKLILGFILLNELTQENAASLA